MWPTMNKNPTNRIRDAFLIVKIKYEIANKLENKTVAFCVSVPKKMADEFSDNFLSSWTSQSA